MSPPHPSATYVSLFERCPHRFAMCRDIFETERARLLDVRACGGTYSAPACATSRSGQIEPASCHSQESTCSFRKESGTSQTTIPAANSHIPSWPEAQSNFMTPHKAASSSALAREEPLTTLSVLTSPAYSNVAPSPTVDPAANMRVCASYSPQSG